MCAVNQRCNTICILHLYSHYKLCACCCKLQTIIDHFRKKERKKISLMPYFPPLLWPHLSAAAESHWDPIIRLADFKCARKSRQHEPVPAVPVGNMFCENRCSCLKHIHKLCTLKMSLSLIVIFLRDIFLTDCWRFLSINISLGKCLNPS